MNPGLGAYTVYQGKVIKIWAGKIHECANAKSIIVIRKMEQLLKNF